MSEKFKGLRSFFILWPGQTLSQLGSAMTAFALTIWAYKQEGTVMSVALLCVCNYVPAAVVSLFAGPWVDRHGKKSVMLLSDSASALMTLLVLIMSLSGNLRVWHLYIINACLGIFGAFQSPASGVAISLLVPKEQYMRVSGLQSFSGSLQSILSPILATAVLAFGGLSSVLAVDLSSFLFAFISLSVLRIPEKRSESGKGESLAIKFREGLTYLGNSRGLRQIIEYLGLINLVAGIAYYSVLNPMILARTGGSDMILGYVNSCIGLGMVSGAALVTWKTPRCRLTTQMCVSYMIAFLLCDFSLAVGRTWPVWCAAAFIGNMPIPFGDGALMTLLRGAVPTEIQGRIFSVRDCTVKLATTVGYMLGAVLADEVCANAVGADNQVSGFFRMLLGEGEGRAMGLVFILTSIAGTIASAALLKSKSLKKLENSL